MPLKGLDALSRWFADLNRAIQGFLALVLMLLVAWIDYVTGTELAFSIFYLGPIALTSWFSGRRVGTSFAFLAAFLWWGAEAIDQKVYSRPEIAYWNTGVRLGFFLVVNHLVGLVRRELERVRELSQRDPLTGATNRRYFEELAEVELSRMSRNRRPLSLAYIDLDNFKGVNDSLGHAAGDRVLTTVVGVLRENLRRPDVVARIGGDEFLLLMPETGAAQVQAVVDRLLEACRSAMEENRWPVSLSIGVATTDQPEKLEELIRLADAQMYVAKEGGKNRAAYTQKGQAV